MKSEKRKISFARTKNFFRLAFFVVDQRVCLNCQKLLLLPAEREGMAEIFDLA